MACYLQEITYICEIFRAQSPATHIVCKGSSQLKEGIEKTFRLLAETPNETADQLLLAALAATYPDVRDAALHAVLGRHTPACHRWLIEHWHQFSPDWHKQLSERQELLSQAVRDAVLNPDPQICANGCQALLAFRNYDQLSILLSVAEHSENPITNCSRRHY